MSKRSHFWGQASGKLGEAVFYRAKGEQRTRAYVAKIKNPKTRSQMLQRIRMANVVSAFRSMAAFARYSFPSKKSQQSDFNRFSQLNVGRSMGVLSSQSFQDGLCIPQGFYISDGNIPIDTSVSFELSSAAGAEGYQPNPFALVKGLVPSNHTYAEGTPGDHQLLSGSEIYEALVGTDNPNNLPGSFVLTVVAAVYYDEGYKIQYQYIECSKTSIDTWHKETAGVPVVFFPAFYAVAVGERDGKRTAGAFALSEAAESVNVLGECAYGLIISWTENGSQRVTRSTLNFNAANEQYRQFIPGGDLYETLLNTWNYTEGNIISTK